MTEEPIDGPDLARLVERLESDPQVYGLFRDRGETHASPQRAVRLHIVTTWDGWEPVRRRLRDLAALVVDLDDAETRESGTGLSVVSGDGHLLELCAQPTSSLTPGDPAGVCAEPILDPNGIITQWSRWAHGRAAEAAAPPTQVAIVPAEETSRADRLLQAAELERTLSGWSRGAAILRHGRADRPLHEWLGLLRDRRRGITQIPGKAADAVRRDVDALLVAFPQPAAGIRIADGDDIWEEFLTIADDEGFAGDRPLLDAARTTLGDAAGREPAFEEGFCTATFDKVEGRFSLGDAIGGCKPPLVPGVVAGVAVSPADDLVFWAAPCVHPPGASLACVADPGDRVTLPRSAGREALFGALTEAVAAAHEELSVLLRRARRAHHETLDDPAAALRPLHLPRSFVLSTKAVGGLVPGTTRLLLSLSLLRAGEDMEPLVAREFGRAAGRLLLAVDPAADTACAPEA